MTPIRAFGNLLVQARSLTWRHRRLNWYLADQIVVSGSNFLTGVIVARSLGIEAFGVYSLAWMLVLFLQSLQTALVLSPMMSIGPKQTPEESPNYYSVIVAHQIAFSAISATMVGAGCLAAHHFRILPEIDALAAPLCAALFFVQIQEFFRRYNFTIENVERVVLSDVIRYGSLIALLILAMSSPNYRNVGVVLYICAASAMLGAAASWSRAPSLRTARTRFLEITRRHFRVSRWLTGSAVLLWVTSNMFTVVAGLVLGPAAVGALKAAQTLMQVTHVFFQAAESFVPSRAARIYHTEGAVGLNRFVKQITLIGVALTAVACLVLAAPARFWLTLIFGAEYGEYGFAVAGYGAYFFLVACILPLRFAFLGAERTSPDFVGYVVASAFTVAASYPLAQHFGLVGAIAGTVAAQVIMLINLYIEYRRFLASEAKKV